MFDSYRWFMDELLAALRAGYDGVAVTEHGQTSYDMTPNPNLPAAVLANAIRTERPETALDRARPVVGQDARAASHRRGVRDVGRDERRPPRRRSAGGPELRRQPEQRHRHGRDTRSVSRGGRADDALLGRGRAVHVERPVLAVLTRQLVAAPAATPAPAGVGSRLGFAGNDAVDDRPGLRVRLPQLVRADADRAPHLRPLLGSRRPERYRAQPVPGRVRAERRRRRDRRSRRDRVRPLRRERVPPGCRQRAWALPRSARLRRPTRDRDAAARPRRSRTGGGAVARHVRPARRGEVGDRRQPGDRARADRSTSSTSSGSATCW